MELFVVSFICLFVFLWQRGQRTKNLEVRGRFLAHLRSIAQTAAPAAHDPRLKKWKVHESLPADE